MLHDVALRVFAHVASAEKHVIVITERSLHRGFPLAVRMLADGGQFYNNFVLLKCICKTYLRTNKLYFLALMNSKSVHISLARFRAFKPGTGCPTRGLADHVAPWRFWVIIKLFGGNFSKSLRCRNSCNTWLTCNNVTTF